MKKYLEKIILLLPVIIICNTALSQPKIKIVNPDYDFGEVSYSLEKVFAEIFITNEGNEVLNIENIKPACGCTVADMPEKNIKPGDTASATFTLNLGNLSGKLSKHVDIFSNDKSIPAARIYLNAFVMRHFEVMPRYLTFNRVIVGKPSVTETLIKNNSDKDAVVKKVSFSREGIICNISEDTVLTKGESFKLIATAIATQPGSIRSEINIELFHPEERTIKVFIYGNAIEEDK